MMKKLTIILIALSLFGCKKEEINVSHKVKFEASCMPTYSGCYLNLELINNNQPKVIWTNKAGDWQNNVYSYEYTANNGESYSFDVTEKVYCQGLDSDKYFRTSVYIDGVVVQSFRNDSNINHSALIGIIK